MAPPDFPPVRRAKNGKYVPTLCPDPNCGGILKLVEHLSTFGPISDWYWECDGLTHVTDDGPLEPCTRQVEAHHG